MTRADDWGDYLELETTDPIQPLPPTERAALDGIGASLREPALWGEPSPDLRARLLDQIAHEAASRQTPIPPRAAIPQAAGSVRPLRSRRVRWLSLAATAAAAAAVVAVLAWPRPTASTLAMSGTALAPKATAVARLEPRASGEAVRLEIKGLTAAPAGAYYAAWARGPAGVVPLGSFHWHKGGDPIDLWSGVADARYPELFVTLQREGSPPTPSDQVVLTGKASG